MTVWNPWHGCTKISAGCLNCYVYRRDMMYGKDSSVVTKTNSFNAPLEKNRKGEYKINSDGGKVYTCMTSDFFLDKADDWRREIWDIIKLRSDLEFVIITKRIERFMIELPEDWEDGYENVTVVCTCENQAMADKRLPVFLQLPIKHREISCEPLLENIDLSPYLETGKIELVTCGGESGDKGRICSYDWILNIRSQCVKSSVSFHFKQTGSNFLKDGKRYRIERKKQHDQADRANIDVYFQNGNSRKDGEQRIPEYENDKEYIKASGEALIPQVNLFSKDESFSALFQRLALSDFRSGFKLKNEEKNYIKEKGEAVIRRHCKDFVGTRLAPARIENDGKQTPMKGHPVFVAQHATGTCCRNCLYKWHNIPKGRELTAEEQDYVVSVIMEWIRRQCQ